MVLTSVVLLVVNVIIMGLYLWKYIELNIYVNSVNFIYEAKNLTSAVATWQSFKYYRMSFFIMIGVVILSVGLIFLAKYAEKNIMPKLREKKRLSELEAETAKAAAEAQEEEKTQLAPVFDEPEKTESAASDEMSETKVVSITEEKAPEAPNTEESPAPEENGFFAAPGDLEASAEEKPKAMFCGNCGAEIAPEAMFCGACGEIINR